MGNPASKNLRSPLPVKRQAETETPATDFLFCMIFFVFPFLQKRPFAELTKPVRKSYNRKKDGKGERKMKQTKLSRKWLSLLSVLFLFFCSIPAGAVSAYAADKAEKNVYVRDGGKGDGSSPDSPLGDLGEAFALLPEGGRILLCGTVTTEKSSCFTGGNCFTEPKHTGKIIIDGSSENSSLDLGNAQRYYLSGPTEFEQVRFKGGETALIAARYYPITFGEGCDTSGILRIYLLGGFNTSVDSRPGSSSITVKSGSFYQIVGFNRMLSGVASTGTAEIELSGSAYAEMIFASVSGGFEQFKSNSCGTMNITLNGASVGRIGDVDRAFNASVKEIHLKVLAGSTVDMILFDVVQNTSLTCGAGADGFADTHGYLFDRIERADGSTAGGSRIRIACVGDSITQGVGSSNEKTASYPAQLASILGRKYEVGNFGVGGSVITCSSERAYTATEKYRESLSFKPDIVLFMLGTNDIALLINGKVDQVYEDALAILESYQKLSPAPEIWILGSTARSDTIERREGVRDILIPMQKKLAKELDARFIDLNALTWDRQQLFPDSLHPDDTGYTFLASVLALALSDTARIPSDQNGQAVTTEPTTEVSVTTNAGHLPTGTEPSSAENGNYRMHPVAAASIGVAVTAILALLFCRKKKPDESHRV